jgi:hypothetical protein
MGRQDLEVSSPTWADWRDLLGGSGCIAFSLILVEIYSR